MLYPHREKAFIFRKKRIKRDFKRPISNTIHSFLDNLIPPLSSHGTAKDRLIQYSYYIAL